MGILNINKRNKDESCKINRLSISFADGKGDVFEKAYDILCVRMKKAAIQSEESDAPVSYRDALNNRTLLLSRLETEEAVLAACEGRKRHELVGTQYMYEVLLLVNKENSDTVIDMLRREYQFIHVDTTRPLGYNETQENYNFKRCANIAKLMLNRVFRLADGNVLKGRSIAGDNITITGNKPSSGELIGLRISMDDDLDISASVVTFTRVWVLRQGIKKKELKASEIAGLPRYNYVDGRMVLANSSMGIEDNDLYVIRKRNPNTRNSMNEFSKKKVKDTPTDIKNGNVIELLPMSKASYLETVVACMNETFKGYVSVSFVDVILRDAYSFSSFYKRKDDARAAFLDAVAGSRFHVVSRLAETDEGNRYVKSLVDALDTFLRSDGQRGVSAPIEVTSGNDIRKDSLNIVLIHEQDYYDQKKEADKYTASWKDGCAIQHVTVESLDMKESQKGKNGRRPMKEKLFGLIPLDSNDELSSDIPEFLIYVLVGELIVKRDCLKGLFSFPYDKTYVVGEAVTFVICDKFKKTIDRPIKGTPKLTEKEAIVETLFFVMDIYSRDNRISFFVGREKELESIPADKNSPNYARFSNLLGELRQTHVEASPFIVADGEGAAFVTKAPFGMHPVYEKLAEIIANGRSSRSNEAKHNCFSGYYGLSTFILDDDWYYFAGLMPDGASTENISRSVIPRKISIEIGDGSRGEDDKTARMKNLVLGTTDRVYLYKDRMNVNPVPVKYLREYKKSWSVENKVIYLAEEADGGLEDDGQEDAEYLQGSLFDDFEPEIEPNKKGRRNTKKRQQVNMSVSDKCHRVLMNTCKKTGYRNLSQMMRSFMEEFFAEFAKKHGYEDFDGVNGSMNA